jgi:hypothetical protein
LSISIFMTAPAFWVNIRPRIGHIDSAGFAAKATDRRSFCLNTPQPLFLASDPKQCQASSQNMSNRAGPIA